MNRCRRVRSHRCTLVGYYVALLSGVTFIATLIANSITFRYRLAAVIVVALLFTAILMLATYYPHGIALKCHRARRERRHPKALRAFLDVAQIPDWVLSDDRLAAG